MAHRKINCPVVVLFLLMTVIFSGCKREAKDPILVRISAVMPHTGQAIAGVKWRVEESIAKGFNGDIEITDFEINGETDASGLAIFEFRPKRKTGYNYHIYFNYSEMNVPSGEYKVVKGPTTFALLYRESENIYDVRILPKMPIELSFKNLNCTGPSDSFKHRTYNMDARPYDNLDDYNWSEAAVYQGCADYQFSAPNAEAGRYVFQWEATRGGVFESGIDTFFVSPGVNNQINMFW